MGLELDGALDARDRIARMSSITHRHATLMAISAVGAVGVFVVPWFVSVGHTPIVSDSYMVGFANWAAVAALLLMAAALGGVSARSETAALSAAGQPWRIGAAGRRRCSLAVVFALAVLSLSFAAALVW